MPTHTRQCALTTGHNLGEGPYEVVASHRRGWGLACSCGWRSHLYESKVLADAAVRQHLEDSPPPPTRRERWRNHWTGTRDRRRPIGS